MWDNGEVSSYTNWHAGEPNNDNLDESTIKEIFESDAPKDAFYDIIGGWDWFDDAWNEYQEILKTFSLNNSCLFLY